MSRDIPRARRRETDFSHPGNLSPGWQSSAGFSDSSYPIFTPSRSPGIEANEMPRGKVGLKTLNHPVDCHLEIVFVHGLLGDASLTWTLDQDKSLFWPEWLPDDPELHNVRVHSYGYHEPPVAGRAPVSKLRERGTALCSDLELSNQIRNPGHTRIVFIAHSLGGLVVKAAIESAKHNAKFHDLARRFHAVLFLATPHQDVDDRDTLCSILRACDTSAASRLDLIEPDPNTSVLREINNSFLACSQDLRIWSFYENSSNPVVDRRRGFIGLSNEIEVRVNAEHGGHAGVARFGHEAFPTYINIKEILIDLVSSIHEDIRNPEKVARELRSLMNNLGLVENIEDEELSRRERRRSPGSCEWLLAKDDFRGWRDKEALSGEKRSQIFWLTGDPGCGKSYLAARVIGHLRERGYDANFFFLKRNDAFKQSIGSLLKSLAYQMAANSSSIRQALMQMQQDNALPADVNESRAVWKQLFVQKVFRVEPERDQYWVIDALDEAKNNHELFQLLQSLPARYSVFVTSRKDSELERELRHMDAKVTMYQVGRQDTLQDIHLFLDQNEEDIHIDEPAHQQMFIKKIADRSNGSFLWTNLVLRQLRQYWNEDALENVIQNVPQGMEFQYDDILKKTCESVNGPLAKDNLRWVICAIRPMSVAELQTAIRLDNRTKLTKSAKAIENICQPLVIVDKDRVEVIHDTVREYLFSGNRDPSAGSADASCFTLDRGASHEKIATLCLECLGNSLKSGGRRMSHDDTSRSDEAFLGKSKNSLRVLATELVHAHTYRQNIKSYIDRRTKFPTHLEPVLQDLYGWADDLIHIVTAFSQDLYVEPRIIHTVIPPLCPTDSKIYSELRNPEMRLQVYGFSQNAWPDQITSTSYGRDYANALACCEKAYAVSLRSQQIVIYHTTTCQEARRFPTAEAIKRLEFVPFKDWPVGSGRRSLTMYNIETGEEIWTKPTTHEIFALTIPADGSCIITVTREKDLETFSIITVCNVHRDVSITKSNIETIAFNPVMKMLAMATFDGELSIVELTNMKKLNGIEVDASHLAVSTDGDYLVVGTKDGNIQIHDFDSLVLIHKISYHEEEFMGLCFTGNGLRFLDIRRQVFNVWEPAALVRRNEDDETASSGGQTFVTGFSTRGQVSLGSDPTPITAIAQHHSGDYIFVAKENGIVAIYETGSGKPKQQLIAPGPTFVSFLAWNEARNLLACGDSSTNVKVFQVLFTQERMIGGTTRMNWSKTDVMRRNLTYPIRQVLLSLDGEFLLVTTSMKELVFRTNGGSPILENDRIDTLTIAEQAQKWATWPRTKNQFLEVHQGSEIITWDKNLKPRKEPLARVELPLIESTKVKNAYLVRVGTKLWSAHDNNQYTAPIVWPQSAALVSEQTAAKIAAQALREFDKIGAKVNSIIGLFRTKMIFVSIDHWICSVRVEKPKFDDPVVRHFPMPHAWRTSNRPLQALVTGKGDVVFAVEGDLVIVKFGLQLEYVTAESPGRPSMPATSKAVSSSQGQYTQRF